MDLTPTKGIESLNSVVWGQMDRFFEATVQATEEAVVNTLVAGKTTVGRDFHRVPRFPIDRLEELLGERAALTTVGGHVQLPGRLQT